MKLNLFKRSMIFATFFGSCLCIALIVASLGTTHWIDARARRTSNPLESEGRINFGLFEGRKELNFGYGWRNHDFSGKWYISSALKPLEKEDKCEGLGTVFIFWSFYIYILSKTLLFLAFCFAINLYTSHCTLFKTTFTWHHSSPHKNTGTHKTDTQVF